MLALDALRRSCPRVRLAGTIAGQVRGAERITATLARAAKACGYQLDKLEAATEAELLSVEDPRARLPRRTARLPVLSPGTLG